jgi:hypothetical protein
MSEGTDGWKAQLPDDLKNNEAFTGFEKIGDFAKDYLKVKGNVTELEGKLGKSIPKLSDNASEEERAAYFNALGRPETVDKYELTKPEIPEGMPYSEEFEKGFKTTAHTFGLTQTQVKGLFDWYMNGAIEAFKIDANARQKAFDDGMEALKKEHGDKYPEYVKTVDRAVQKFGGDEFKKFMDDSGLGNNPVIVKTFYNIGKAISEDTLAGGEFGGDNRKLGIDGKPLLEYPNSPGMKE